MIKFAVIGYGRIGRRHAEVIRCTANAQLVAVCDILPKEQVGLENIEVPYFRSIDELLDSDLDIDVVNICTPNGFHAEYAIKALEKEDSNRSICYCKDCAKHNIDIGDFREDETGRHWLWKDEACPLVPFRGKAQGHEFDYQYCAYGKLKSD